MIIRYNTKTIRLKKTLLCILLSPVIIFGQWDLNPVNFFPTDDPAFNLSRANVDPDSLSCKAGFYLNYVVNLSTLEVAPITMPSGMLLVPSSTRIRIDMDNDGIWELDYTGDQQVQTVEFDYPEVPTGSQGNHTIHFRIDATYYDLLGATLEEEFHKYYPVLTWPMPDQSWESANGDLLIQIQSQDGILDKPLLIVEGFDVFNHSWPSDIYYQTRTFTEGSLQEAGYDLFMLNFGDGGTALQNNAMAVMGALEIINSLNPEEKTRIIGLSMGGVLARFALAWAEENNVEHGCDMFISFDSPQKGAHINAGLQSLISEYELNNSIIEQLQALLQSTAAKQLMTYNVYDAPQPGQDYSQWEGGPMFNEFYTALSSLNGSGYPEQTVNIAISNGQGNCEERIIYSSYPDAIVGSSVLSIVLEGIPILSVPVELGDVYPGSYLSSWPPEDINSSILIPIPIFGYSEIEYSINFSGSPSFIWAESALDLQGVVNDPSSSNQADIVGWDSTPFDLMLLQPNGSQYHDRLSEETRQFLGDILIDSSYTTTLFQIYIEDQVCDGCGEFSVLDLYAPFPAGEERELLRFVNWTINAENHQLLDGEYQFHHWNNDPFHYYDKIEHSFIQTYATMTANYERVYNVHFDDHIELHDPWYLDQDTGNQPDTFVPASNICEKVFAYENSCDDSGLPVYHLRAQPFYHDPVLGQNYLFSRWQANLEPGLPDALDLIAHFSDPENPHETCVIFYNDLENYPDNLVAADYKEEISVNVSLPQGFAASIHDPWFYNEQLSEFENVSRDLTSGDLAIFPEEYYQVTVLNQYFVEDNDIYAFSHWSGENVQITSPNSATTEVLFQNENATLVLNLIEQPVNQIENYTAVIDGPEHWHLQDDTIITFADGFTMQINGELMISGGEQGPAVLQSSSSIEGLSLQSNGYTYLINLKIIDYQVLEVDNGRLRLENVALQNPAGVWAIQGSNNSEIQVFDTEISGCYGGILSTDYSGNGPWKALTMNKVAIHGLSAFGSQGIETENITADFDQILVTGFDTGYRGEWTDDTQFGYYRENRIDNSTLVYNAVDIIWNSHYDAQLFLENSIFFISDLDPIFHINHCNEGIPDPLFVNPEERDYSLQWGSPCIDAGNPTQHDMDGTISDIGAFVYHQTRGDVIADNLLNILDVVAIVNSILFPTGSPLTANQRHCADVNLDENIDILDAVLLVDCIEDYECYSLGNVQKAKEEYHQGHLLFSSAEQLDRSESDDVILVLDSEVPIRGFQMELQFDENSGVFTDAELAEPADGFQLSYTVNDNGSLNVVAYPVDSFQIPAGEHEILILHFQQLSRGMDYVNPVIQNAIVSDYKAAALDLETDVSINPQGNHLFSPFPNPFNPNTAISFYLVSPQEVELSVLDLTGRQIEVIENTHMQAGHHRFQWNGDQFASGIYFVRLKTSSETRTTKLVLMK